MYMTKEVLSGKDRYSIVLLNFVRVPCISEFVGKDWQIWKGPVNGSGLFGKYDQDDRSNVLVEVDFNKVRFSSCLKIGETSISGEEKLKRLKENGHILLGANVCIILWEDYQENGRKSLLERLRENFGITCLDFFGSILRGPCGRRCVLYLRWKGSNEWFWNSRWLGRNWDSERVSLELSADNIRIH